MHATILDIEADLKWCRCTKGLFRKRETPFRDQDGKTIVTFYLGGVSLAGEHLDERKRSWENTYPREARVRRTKAQRLHVPRSGEEKTPIGD